MESWSEALASATLTEADNAELEELGIPLIDHNAALLDNVHPRSWPDPDPTGVVYDIIAIGAGAAGLVSAKQTARRGGRSALIEAHLHGGDCLNVGCVPSKALIRCARAIKDAKNAASLGIHVGEVKVDFPFIMERMRKLRARIAPNDALTLTSKVGADVFQGKGRFTGEHTIEVNGKTLHFKKAVVATGGQPRVPPIPGLDKVPFVTNKTLFNLSELPRRMIVGAGPIGIEMAQAFALFGSEVTVLDVGAKVLPREEPEAAAIIEAALREDGVTFYCGIKDLNFSSDSPKISTANFVCSDGTSSSLDADCLLVATGRAPNVQGIGLEEAKVEYDPRFGIPVNDLMVTSNPDIYAIGDCSTKWQFTHMAGTQAMMVVENAVFGGDRKVSELVVPRCTYTHPEVAGTGMSETDIKEAGIEYEMYKADLTHNDRAILEGSDNGFCKIFIEKETAKVLGATIVAECAGEMISEISLAIYAGLTLPQIQRTIHPYPTVAECIAGCAFGHKAATWATKPKE